MGSLLSSPLLYLCAVTVMSALAICFKLYIAKFNQKNQENRDLITCGQKLCDEILEHVGCYWRTNPTDSEAEKLSIKISTSAMLIAHFVRDSFAQDNNIDNMLEKMIDEVTGGDFGIQSKLPKPDRITPSIRSIIKLRCALSKAKPKD